MVEVAFLSDIADVNPRAGAIGADEPISFVGLAELDGAKAIAVPRDTRLFAEVSKGYTVFRDRDILVAKITPSWENGKVGQARLAHAFGVGSTEFHVVRPNERSDARYVLHYLRQWHVRESGRLRMTGSGGQRRVPSGFLKDLRIPLPTLNEQRRIATVLDAADAIRSKRKAVLAHLDTLTQASFNRAFGHTPSGAHLGDIASVTSGITKGRRTTEPTTAVPYLAVSNVQAGFLRLNTVSEIEATNAEIERYRLRTGDLVLTEGGDPDKLGRGTIWRDELPLAIHQNHIFRVRIHEDAPITAQFIEGYLGGATARAYFLRAAKQTTGIATINMSQLCALTIPVPPLDAQKAFAEKVARIDAARTTVQRSIDRDDELFASLQSRAFSGKL